MKCPSCHTDFDEKLVKSYEALEWLSQGMSNVEIANEMKVTPNVVSRHIQVAIKHFGARGRVDLAVKYIAQKSKTTFVYSTPVPIMSTGSTWTLNSSSVTCQ